MRRVVITTQLRGRDVLETRKLIVQTDSDGAIETIAIVKTRPLRRPAGDSMPPPSRDGKAA